MPIVELSSETYKNGRRPFKATLYKLQPPESVVNGVGTLYNDNGLTFLEEYASKQLDSIKDMSVRVAFLDDERSLESDHGDTGFDNGLAVFENATVVGHFVKGYIDDVEINGVMERCVIGEGYLDEMCYPVLVKRLSERLANHDAPHGSIEIFKAPGNKEIIYLSGYREKGRIPVKYIHSGWDIVFRPADETSVILEINSKNKEEKDSMSEKEIKDLIQSTIVELNNNNEQYNKQISELNVALDGAKKELCDKDDLIENYIEQIKALEAAKAELEKKVEAITVDTAKQVDVVKAEKDKLLDEIGVLQKEKKLAELQDALAQFTDKEREYASSEINSFKEAPLEGNIEEIKSKICVGIVENQKKKLSEINSKQEIDNSLYGEIFNDNDLGDKDYDMY